MSNAAVTAEPKSKKKPEVSPEPVAPVSQPTAEASLGAPAGMPLFLASTLQRKLAVGSADDPLEREADRIADQVAGSAAHIGPLQHPAHAQQPRLQRKCACGGQCDECRKDKEELAAPPILRRQANSGGPSKHHSPGQAPPIVHQALRSSGRPLDAPVRSLMESRFQRDFSDVRVHTGPLASRSANAINAVAYTAGNHLVFTEGSYSPGTPSGQQLLAHELVHTLQQGGSVRRQTADPSATDTPVVPTAPGDSQQLTQSPGGNDPAVDAALQAEIDSAVLAMNQDKDLMLRALSARMVLLLQYHSHPPLKEQADLDSFVDACRKLAVNEMDTLSSFSPGGAELALAGFPKGFPLTWSGRVQSALTLGADPTTIVLDSAARLEALSKSAHTLGSDIFAHGLPVPFGDRSRLQDFHLRVSDGSTEKASPVRDYARESIHYMQLKWLSLFAFGWEMFVDEIAEAVADGTVVVRYIDWKDFVDNKQAILRDLPARAREQVVQNDEDARQMETDAVNLREAALCVGMASAFVSFFGILSGWNDASSLFDGALHSADKSVGGEGQGARITTALQWAWDNDYLGGAAAAWAQSLIDNGPEILAEIALILILQAIPGVDIAVDIYLYYTAARGVLSMIGELAASLNDVMGAASVGELQEGAARLAQILTSGAILILIVLITHGIAKASKNLRKRSEELQAADPTLTEEAADKQALKDLSSEERKALEDVGSGEAAEISKKFEEFEGACTLGSIICRTNVPQHILDEAGEYPTLWDVPMPKGPFTVQKAILADVERSPQFLRDQVIADRARFPEFDKALKAAEKKGKKWVYDENGNPWEVHHVKPVFMGGDSEIGNLAPLPRAVHQKYTNYWNSVHRAFRKRFTEKEWGRIYTRSTKDVAGSAVRKTPQ